MVAMLSENIPLDAGQKTVAVRYVRNEVTGVRQEFLLDGMGTGPCDWQTRCGWRYRSCRLPARSAMDVCRRCQTAEKATFREREAAASPFPFERET